MSRAPDRTDRRIALGLFLGSFALLWATEAAVGFVRDESVYFAAGEQVVRWLRLLVQMPGRAMSDSVTTQAFDFNHEHPLGMKLLFGLSWQLFHQGLGWLRPATAFRLPAFALAATIPAVLHAWGAVLFGRRAGLFAALCFLAVPRHFFHAHLACFDMPVAALWLLVVYAFWRAETDPGWWLWTGLLFGAALATKHNALFLPLVLLPFALVRAVRACAGKPAARALLEQLGLVLVGGAALLGILALLLTPAGLLRGWELLSPPTAVIVLVAAALCLLGVRLHARDGATFRAVAPLLAMALVGPAVLYVVWPWLWYHPVDRFRAYLEFHATHVHYAWMYLGRVLREPPFPVFYVLVVTALTLPVSVLAPMGTGLLSVGVRAVTAGLPRLPGRSCGASASELLVGINALASIVLISLPDVPHFGGVKHWLPSMPFLALLAGSQVQLAGDALGAWLARRHPGLPAAAVTPALGALLLLPAATLTAHVHPYGTSAYGELAGGVPGAASLGMQRQYWSNNVTGVLGWINLHAPRGARVWLHEVHGLSFRDYQQNGMLRADLRPAGGPGDADVAAVQYHQEFREQEVAVWQAFGTTRPVAGLYIDETPQVVVYRRP
ncbi:MAG TPA: glycosyltransferase family 39 protein [Myxococcaceae bacterium]|nr:glycosyltransferase family 39 protein [Myxococcaceae bacterium]